MLASMVVGAMCILCTQFVGLLRRVLGARVGVHSGACPQAADQLPGEVSADSALALDDVGVELLQTGFELGE